MTISLCVITLTLFLFLQCDLHMPRKDGFQACAEVRQWEKARKLPLVPIIALSANVMEDVVEKCAAAGFSNFVAKPVDFEELSRAIKGNLDPTRAHVLMSHPAITHIQTAPEPPLVTSPPLPPLGLTRSSLFMAKLPKGGDGFVRTDAESTLPSAPAPSLLSATAYMLTSQQSMDEGAAGHWDMEPISPSVCSAPEPSYGTSTPIPSYMASMVESSVGSTPGSTPAPSFMESKPPSPVPSI